MDADHQPSPPDHKPMGCGGCLVRAALTVVIAVFLIGWVCKIVDDWNNDSVVKTRLRAMGLSGWVDEGQLKIQSRGIGHFASDPTNATMNIPPSTIDDFTATLTKAGFQAEPLRRSSASTQSYAESSFATFYSPRTEEYFQVSPGGRILITVDTFGPHQPFRLP